MKQALILIISILSINFYGQTVGLNPTDAVSYNQRGNDRFRLGDYKRAIEDYTKAIELKLANEKEAYCNRGSC